MSTVSYEHSKVPPTETMPRRSGRMRWIASISWRSVFAGVAVALGVQILFSMLGTGIGMSTIDPLRVGGTPSPTAFSVGAGLWWVVSSFIALVAGGWVAAQFSGYLRHVDGILHGLLVWALTTLITIYLLGSAVSSITNSAANMASAGLHGMAESTSAMMPADYIKEDARSLFSSSGTTVQPTIDPFTGQTVPARPQSVMLDPEFTLALERFLTSDQADVKENNRTQLINLLTTRTGMSVDEAANRVNSWERTYDQAEQKARVMADNMARAISRTALWGFLGILLSAIAGVAGGFVGTPIPEVVPETNLRAQL